MRPLVFALVLGLSPSTASAFWPFGARILQADPLAGLEKLSEQGRHEQVLEQMDATLYRRDLTSGDRRRAFLLFGASLEATDRYDRALTNYQVGLQLFPRDKDLTLALARVFHHEDLDDKARPLFERVLEWDHKNAQAHIGLAESYQSLGLLDSAVDHYREAVGGWWSGDAVVWTEYARALADTRAYPEAEQAEQKAIKLSPSAERLESLAVYQKGQGKLEQALASLSAAIDSKPDDSALRLRRALWLAGFNRNDEARKDADQALALSPGDPLGLWIRGLLEARSRNPAAAIKDFRQASKGQGLVAKAAAAALKGLEAKP